MRYDTYKEAEDAYYETHQCNTDDSDIEQAKIDRWIEDNGHVITEDQISVCDSAAPQRKAWVEGEQQFKWLTRLIKWLCR